MKQSKCESKGKQYAERLQGMYTMMSREGPASWMYPSELAELERLHERVCMLESPERERQFVEGCLLIGRATHYPRIAA